MPRTADASADDAGGLSAEASTGDRRERLLAAGEEIFATRRYEDVSAQDIARRAGVAHGLLFHYFKSKRGFYFAVLERYAQRGREVFEANTLSDPARWLRREIDTFLDAIAGREQILPALFHGSLGAETEAQRIVNRERDATAERVIAKLAPGRRSALLKIAVTAWVASCNELGVEWLETGRTVPRRALRKVLVFTLNETLRKVAAIDRSASFDPDRFASA